MTKETNQDVFDALMADMSHGSEQWRTRYDAAASDVIKHDDDGDKTEEK